MSNMSSIKCVTPGCLHTASAPGLLCEDCRRSATRRAAGRLGIRGDEDAWLRRRAIRRWCRRWSGVAIVGGIVLLTAYGLLRVEDARRRQAAQPVAQVVRVTDHRYEPARMTARKPLLPRLAGTEGMER